VSDITDEVSSELNHGFTFSRNIWKSPNQQEH